MQVKVSQTNELKPPSLLKLGACLIYEALVIIAIAFLSAWVFLLAFGDASHGIKRYALQMFLWSSIGIYFIWCWHKSGQTLAMQTWHLKLITQNHQLPSLGVAITRYILASIGLVLFGIGFLWPLIDPDRLFLHDRLLKTKLTVVQRNTA